MVVGYAFALAYAVGVTRASAGIGERLPGARRRGVSSPRPVYQLSKPAAHLAPYIEHYWFVSATEATPFDLRVDVYVDARANLVFNFGVPPTRERSWVSARGCSRPRTSTPSAVGPSK